MCTCQRVTQELTTEGVEVVQETKVPAMLKSYSQEGGGRMLTQVYAMRFPATQLGVLTATHGTRRFEIAQRTRILQKSLHLNKVLPTSYGPVEMVKAIDVLNKADSEIRK